MLKVERKKLPDSSIITAFYSFNFVLKIYFMYTCECLDVCLMPMRPEEGIGTLGTGIIGNCRATMWVLGTKPWSFARAAGDLNC